MKKEVYIVDENTVTALAVMDYASDEKSETVDYAALVFFDKVVSDDYQLILGFRSPKDVDMVIDQLNTLKKEFPT